VNRRHAFPDLYGRAAADVPDTFHSMQATFSPAFQTEAVTAWRDRTGTLRIAHHGKSDAQDPWDVASITDEFAQALLIRRQRQGGQIIRRYGEVLRSGPVLDYGCGQGAFLSQLLAASISATGCDLGVPRDAHADHPERFQLLDQPWGIPAGGPWNTVVLLDVLEHHPEPTAFLRKLKPENFLIKVPLLHGPVGLCAQLALRTGRPTLMHSLLLVGDVSPHLTFFTAEGLDTVLADAGYTRESMLRQADVGAELPARIRGPLAPSSQLVRILLTLGGVSLAAFSRVWTDTATFHYTRTNP
jgi:hypothetical protein